MLKGFKQFILRGNVVDLAVGVVIGAAFNNVVNALVKDLLTPIFGIFGQSLEFASWTLHVRSSSFAVGDFLNQVIAFVIEAAAIYFFVVLPLNALIARTQRAPAPIEPTTKKCQFCFSEIPKQATKCAFCTSSLTQ